MVAQQIAYVRLGKNATWPTVHNSSPPPVEAILSVVFWIIEKVDPPGWNKSIGQLSFSHKYLRFWWKKAVKGETFALLGKTTRRSKR